MKISDIISELIEYGITYNDLADTQTYFEIQSEYGLSDAEMSNMWDQIISGELSLDIFYIPEGTKVIESGRYAGNANIKAVVFPSTLVTVEDNAFANCFLLRSVQFNDGLKEIGQSAFFHTSLEDIVIPKSVKSVGQSAFSNCEDLTSFTCLGNTYLDNYAVAYCKNLSHIDVTFASVADNCFAGSESDIIGNSEIIEELSSDIFDWLYDTYEIDDDYKCLRGNILPSGEILHNPNNCVHNVIENEICKYLAEIGITYSPNQGMYGELILDKLNCIRLNGQHEFFIVIPEEVTNNQLYTLREWVDYIFKYYGYKRPINITDIIGNQMSFSPDEYSGDDIVKYIRNNLI